MKRLRGTKLDPFGWDPDRRTERALIVEYERLITDLTRPGTTEPYDARVLLAGSAMEIKGYAVVKEAAVDRWRAQVRKLRSAVDRRTGGR
jgi:indolepyruvate ferredoxin oxidoreductase